MIDVVKGGQWLKLSLPDGRTGWVTSRYVSSLTTRTPSTTTSPTTKKPQHTEEGTVTHIADGDTITVITTNHTKLRIRMVGIDAPETPKGTTFPGQPYGNDAEAYLKQLIDGLFLAVSGKMAVTLGLVLPTTSEHSMLLLLLMIEEFLNAQLTSQKKAMILRADAGRISETLFDHPNILS